MWPHNLEIKTKSRAADKIQVMEPPSRERTPSQMNPVATNDRKEITKGALMSTHTLAMSQIDGKDAAMQ